MKNSKTQRSTTKAAPITKELFSPKPPPRLRFLPTAWAKLLYLRDRGETEIGCFGLTETADPLLVTDVQLVKQVCSWVTVAFDDAAVADFFEAQVDRGLQPHQFARIWIHTHPGHSADPSATDERTFSRVFGAADWAVMFILAQGGQTYGRLQFTVGPGGAIPLRSGVDFSHPFGPSDWNAWEQQYQQAVHAQPELTFETRPPTERKIDSGHPTRDEDFEFALSAYDDFSAWLFP